MLKHKPTGNLVELRKILDDKALFKAYPTLARYKIEFADLEQGEGGYFIKGSDRIVLSKNLSKFEQKSALYHELQHAVQEIEDFAQGGRLESL